MSTYGELQASQRLYQRLSHTAETTRNEARRLYINPDDEEDIAEQKLDANLDTFPEIITQVGRWAITSHGIECLTEYYVIHRNALKNDWIDHMSEKAWVTDLDDFATALYHARAIHKYLAGLGIELP